MRQQHTDHKKQKITDNGDLDTGCDEILHDAVLYGNIHKHNFLTKWQCLSAEPQFMLRKNTIMFLSLINLFRNIQQFLIRGLIKESAGGYCHRSLVGDGHRKERYPSVPKHRSLTKRIFMNALQHPVSLLFHIVFCNIENHAKDNSQHNCYDEHIDANKLDFQPFDHGVSTSRW